MLTPKPKVCKVLKKVKKNWSHELKLAASHYYKNVSRQGTADLKRINLLRYQDGDA